MKRFEFARFGISKGYLKDSAFDLHQTAERLYSCLLLTLTFYAPYNHNIAFLRSLAEGLDRRVYGIWPEATRRERAMFQKLKEAYTKARYSRHYRISEEELAWLSERIEELGCVVHQVCADRIAELEAAARQPSGACRSAPFAASFPKGAQSLHPRKTSARAGCPAASRGAGCREARSRQAGHTLEDHNN